MPPMNVPNDTLVHWWYHLKRPLAGRRKPDWKLDAVPNSVYSIAGVT